jgi:hypothetical protein
MRHDSPQPRPRPVDGRKIRIDPNPPEAPEAKEERNRFLELFRLLLGVPVRDRRFMPRHEAAEFAIWLGWWRGEAKSHKDFVTTNARLINISRGGALITAIDPPPHAHKVWICLGAPEPSDCVEAIVRQVTTVRRRQCAVRLSFTGSCPQAFFEVAVCGIAAGPRVTASLRRFVEGN